MDCKDPRAAEVIGFWFREPGRDKRWFAKDAAFDEEIRARFLPRHEEALRGDFASWKARDGDCLALILLLDQFPRNLFRGTARAFAGDAHALEAARHALASGYDRGMRPVERLFAYLPFEHSESPEDQRLSCRLMRPLADYPETDDAYRYAVRHLEVIQRFGRFPHRNAALGRASTEEELAFLKQPGSGF